MISASDESDIPTSGLDKWITTSFSVINIKIQKIREMIMWNIFLGKDYRVVFVNTANHALAGLDTNSRIWKWEYIPYTKIF